MPLDAMGVVVVDDDTACAALVVGHLAELGHRRIAHIEHLETDPARLAQMPNAVRAEGYRQAMRTHGPDGRPEHVVGSGQAVADVGRAQHHRSPTAVIRTRNRATTPRTASAAG
ncbi:substrate-binding domain-containing protein [Lentzea sp. NPDC051838]|uniref:substrate-binding domain-containing protein n=1 Tax=Lentzea sp. NPDC051838 TaxID=3154849 RepID=UPI00341D3947